MTAYRTAAYLFLAIFLFSAGRGLSQCTVLGQNPNTAFPVCGTTVFEQTNVPICGDMTLAVPGCSGAGGAYADKNPFWYRFTCFQAGSLGFVITPKDITDDYDWQLYDITSIDPLLIYTTPSTIVTGNWSGSSGTTGASGSGVDFIQCASPADGHAPTFAAMPELIVGHTYILLVSHFTDSQSGYSLSFGGGTAVITDPKEPHLQTVTPDCDGKKLTLKLNKKMKCGSLSTTGSEFSISPAVCTVVSAVATNCSTGFDFDEVVITLSTPVPSGDYELVIKNGSDANTLLDNCDRTVPETEHLPFKYSVPQPTPIDSIERIGCAPDLLKLHFSKKIACGSIAADGSDFTITGPTPVTVATAFTDCTTGFNDVITVRLSAPIYTAGNYVLSVRPGTDGNTVIDQCGLQTPPQTVPFTTVDTVSARFTYTNALGCRNDTLTFAHDGANGVNSWNWLFNNNGSATTPSHTIVFPGSSSNTIQLIVSNGTCSDTANNTVILDNEVKASFDMPSVICPEDPLIVTNTTTGLVDVWKWNFDVIASSNSKDPQPVFFPNTNIESAYTIKLLATNTALGCTDSVKHRLKVLNNCYIAVPTAFTPNNDGRNDYLYPNNAIKAENLEFTVYNRWGQVVFHSRDWTQKWDGTIGGIPQASGVYVWMLEYTHRDTKQRVFQKGTTTLIR